MPDHKRKRKPDVAIIGAGRLGTTLATALTAKGYSIKSLVARRAQSARKAAARFDGNVAALAARQIRSLPSSDLILISVPDDQIGSVAAALSQLDVDRKPIVLHTSGALSSAVLAPLGAKGWSTGSVHPLISVSDPDAPIRGWAAPAGFDALRDTMPRLDRPKGIHPIAAPVYPRP